VGIWMGRRGVGSHGVAGDGSSVQLCWVVFVYGVEGLILKRLVEWMKLRRGLVAVGSERRKGIDSALRLSLQCRV